jgi:hypothetical protein
MTLIVIVVSIPVGMFLMEYVLEGGDDQTMGQFALMLLKALVKS